MLCPKCSQLMVETTAPALMHLSDGRCVKEGVALRFCADCDHVEIPMLDDQEKSQ